MDLSSSSTTQRGSTSDVLSVQPGSVRVSTADAASEFARHLAENSQARTNGPEDRPAERRERPEARDRTRRDEAAESRKAAKESRKNDDEKNVDGTEETEASSAPVEANPASNGIALSDTPATERADAQTDETSSDTGGETETESASGGVAADKPAAEAPKEEAAADTGEAVATVTQTATSQSSAVTADAAKEAPIAANAPVKPGAQDKTAASEVAPVQIVGETAVDKAANTKPIEKPGTATKFAADQQSSSESTGAGDTTISDAEAEVLSASKPAKGLGQEAAESLAEKKTDGKQSQQPATTAAQGAAGQQTQRAQTAANQQAPITGAPADTTSSTRSGDLPTTSIAQTSGASTNGATVRIGTLPGQSQPTQLPTTTIALQMARNLQKGTNRFDIRLDPPEMGRIDVRMEVRKDGHVVAHMTVDRPETLDLLQRDARALQQALNNAGLQADSDSLNFSLRDQNGNSGSPDFAGSGRSGIPSGDADAETAPAPIYNVNLAANGGIDIRV